MSIFFSTVAKSWSLVAREDLRRVARKSAGFFGAGVGGSVGGGAGAVHGLAEEGVDAGLVAGARALEPVEDVGVEADRY